MKPSPIRELARRYAAGELSLEEYRKQRRHMIDAVCAGTLKIEYGETAPRKIRNRDRRWLLAVPVIVVIAIGVVVALHYAAVYQAHTGSATPHAAATVSGTQLLHAFTDANDWSTASVSTFLRQWQELPASEKRAARASYLFPRLLAQLHEQIISQQAMLEIAPAPEAATHHLAQLQQLSGALRGQSRD